MVDDAKQTRVRVDVGRGSAGGDVGRDLVVDEHILPGSDQPADRPAAGIGE
jgi:hypothetical protein